MSNTYKVIIALVAIVIVSSAAIFINSQNRVVQTPLNVLVSSSPDGISSAVLASSSSVVSSSLVSESVSMVSVAPVTDQPKVETPAVVQPKVETPQVDLGSNPNPIQNIPNVTKLSTDKSIYWQYIKDYLACPTKFYQPLNAGYIYDGLSEYQYLCIPQAEADKCPTKSLIYGLPSIVGKSMSIIDFTNPTYDRNPFSGKYDKIIEKNKYYCIRSFESIDSVSITSTSGYGSGIFPSGLDSILPGYFVIPKSILPVSGYADNSKISFAAIPLESFSKEDQAYIANNFTAK